MSEAPPPIPQPPPRVWSVLTVTALTIAAALILGGIVQGIGMFAIGAFQPGAKSFDVVEIMQKVMDQPWGSTALVLPGQLTMLAAALAAALLSPQRVGPRLGFTRSALPWWTLPLLVGGTFFAGGLGGLLVEWLFEDPGMNLRLMVRMMQNATGPGLALLVVLMCVLPPLSEEMLFRGYLQRRLLQRWSPALAIAVSTVFFTAAHFDPVHVLAVIPIGVWLGVVAWRCGSIWPAMLCHAAQNSFALWSVRQGDPFERGASTGEIIMLAVSGLLAIGAVAAMRRHPPAPCRVLVPRLDLATDRHG